MLHGSRGGGGTPSILSCGLMEVLVGVTRVAIHKVTVVTVGAMSCCRISVLSGVRAPQPRHKRLKMSEYES